jgi:hypothetical protein
MGSLDMGEAWVEIWVVKEATKWVTAEATGQKKNLS